MLDVRGNLKVKGKPSKTLPLLYKEVKKQGSEFALLKAQSTTFKAVVNQRLGKHEKSVEFMSEKFDEFELQLDGSKKDTHLLWGKKRIIM